MHSSMAATKRRRIEERKIQCKQILPYWNLEEEKEKKERNEKTKIIRKYEKHHTNKNDAATEAQQQQRCMYNLVAKHSTEQRTATSHIRQ